MPMAWHLLAEVGNDTQNWPVFEVKVGNGHSLLVPLMDGLVPPLQGEPDSPEGDSCFHVVFPFQASAPKDRARNGLL